MSTSGSCSVIGGAALGGAGVGDHAPQPALGTARLMAATRHPPSPGVRPLTTTSAPSAARVAAICRPMPPVEAVTRAVLPCQMQIHAQLTAIGECAAS